MEISINGHNQDQMTAALIHPIPSPSNFPHNPQQEMNKKPKYQQINQAPNSCPRCDSTNTKFCYYNNYSLSQPRYFCKACRRYWTKGGILRNVPVGGGCRKNKRSSSSSSSSSSPPPNSSSSKKSQLSSRRPQESDLLMIKNVIFTKPSPAPPTESIPNFRLPNDDLTLAFNTFLVDRNPNPNPSFLDILRGGGGVDPTQQSSHGGAVGGFQSLCYGFGTGGGNDQLLRGNMIPFHGGGDSTQRPSLIAAAAPGMEVVVRDDDDDDEVGGGNHDNAVGLGLETGRDYWNDGATVSSSSTWHGLVNSSFL